VAGVVALAALGCSNEAISPSGESGTRADSVSASTDLLGGDRDDTMQFGPADVSTATDGRDFPQDVPRDVFVCDASCPATDIGTNVRDATVCEIYPCTADEVNGGMADSGALDDLSTADTLTFDTSPIDILGADLPPAPAECPTFSAWQAPVHQVGGIDSAAGLVVNSSGIYASEQDGQATIPPISLTDPACGGGSISVDEPGTGWLWRDESLSDGWFTTCTTTPDSNCRVCRLWLRSDLPSGAVGMLVRLEIADQTLVRSWAWIGETGTAIIVSFDSRLGEVGIVYERTPLESSWAKWSHFVNTLSFASWPPGLKADPCIPDTPFDQSRPLFKSRSTDAIVVPMSMGFEAVTREGGTFYEADLALGAIAPSDCGVLYQPLSAYGPAAAYVREICLDDSALSLFPSCTISAFTCEPD
jgi:hypothetical protein